MSGLSDSQDGMLNSTHTELSAALCLRAQEKDCQQGPLPVGKEEHLWHKDMRRRQSLGQEQELQDRLAAVETSGTVRTDSPALPPPEIRTKVYIFTFDWWY